MVLLFTTHALHGLYLVGHVTQKDFSDVNIAVSQNVILYWSECKQNAISLYYFHTVWLQSLSSLDSFTIAIKLKPSFIVHC